MVIMCGAQQITAYVVQCRIYRLYIALIGTNLVNGLIVYCTRKQLKICFCLLRD